MVEIFSSRLRDLRKERKIYQREVGDELGVCYTTVSGYESGRNEPSLELLCHLADYFDVSTDYLLGRSNEKNIAEERAKAKAYTDLENISLADAFNVINEYHKRKTLLK